MSSVTEAFDNLKQTFTFAPCFVHVDLEKSFTTEENASDFALESVLSHVGDDKKSNSFVHI